MNVHLLGRMPTRALVAATATAAALLTPAFADAAVRVTADPVANTLLIVGTNSADITQVRASTASNKIEVDRVPVIAASPDLRITVLMQAGDDKVDARLPSGSYRSMSIQGGSGNDRLLGGNGPDVLFGQAGNDQIDAFAGNDRLVGGTGDDAMGGGSGSDRLVQGPTDTGDDVFDGGPAGATDRVELVGSNLPEFFRVRPAATGFTIRHTVSAPGNPYDLSVLNVAELDVNARGGDDVVTGDLTGLTTTLTADGGDGDDVLSGSPNADSLDGGAGDDTLRGGLGFDTLTGGAGDDDVDAVVDEGGSIDAGAGRDSVTVSRIAPGGDDLALEPDAAGRVIVRDTDAPGAPPLAISGSEALTVRGKVGSPNRINAIALTNPGLGLNLIGGRERDVLIGSYGTDAIYGQSGDDELRGGPGTDLLNGGAGSDVLGTRDGTADTLHCGTDGNRGDHDVASADHIDTVAADCEQVLLP